MVGESSPAPAQSHLQEQGPCSHPTWTQPMPRHKGCRASPKNRPWAISHHRRRCLPAFPTPQHRKGDNNETQPQGSQASGKQPLFRPVQTGASCYFGDPWAVRSFPGAPSQQPGRTRVHRANQECEKTSSQGYYSEVTIHPCKNCCAKCAGDARESVKQVGGVPGREALGDGKPTTL